MARITEAKLGWTLTSTGAGTAQLSAYMRPATVMIVAEAAVLETHNVRCLMRHGIVEHMIESFACQHVCIEAHEVRSAPAACHASATTLQVETDINVCKAYAKLGKRKGAHFGPLCTNQFLLLLHDLLCCVLLRCMYYMAYRFLCLPKNATYVPIRNV
jgi:hypothetical protein